MIFILLETSLTDKQQYGGDDPGPHVDCDPGPGVGEEELGELRVLEEAPHGLHDVASFQAPLQTLAVSQGKQEI